MPEKPSKGKGSKEVSPELREKEKKPAMTIAMGMKMTRDASQCWKDQVQKEMSIREEWKRLYVPESVEQEKEIIERVMEREKAKQDAAKQCPDRELLYDGKGRKAYLKSRLTLPPQKKAEQPLTASQSVGWKCLELPPPKNPDLPSFGRKPVIRNGFYRKTLGGTIAV